MVEYSQRPSDTASAAEFLRAFAPIGAPIATCIERARTYADPASPTGSPDLLARVRTAARILGYEA